MEPQGPDGQLGHPETATNFGVIIELGKRDFEHCTVKEQRHWVTY
jgi:hypothetical protein